MTTPLTPASGSKWRSLVNKFVQASAVASVGLQNRAIFTPPADHTETFEVTAPLTLPPATVPKCTVDLGMHDFAFSYGAPWVIPNYAPPTECGSEWSKVVLNLGSAVEGRQFDRVYEVWIGGAEALRGCTDEPSRKGIYWTVEKDITDMSPILKDNQTIVVAIDNIVDGTYTGIYHTYVSIDFYAATPSSPVPSSVPDLLIPLSASKTSYAIVTLDGSGKAAEFTVPAGSLPRNIARAELEYYVSNHANDEFYYTNVPDSYAQPDLGVFGHGTHKELQVLLDGKLVGLDWPVPVIYTGGFNPLLWRPIVAIGSQNFPTYRFELTPFLGSLTDGAAHTFTLNVTNQTPGSLWYVDANLRLWLDSESTQTTSTITTLQIPTPDPKVVLTTNDAGDANITTTLIKEYQITSTIKTSAGTNQITIRKRLSLDSYVSYTNQTNNLQGHHNLLKITQQITSKPDSTVTQNTIRNQKSTLDFNIAYIGFDPSFSSYIVNTTINQSNILKLSNGTDVNSIREGVTTGKITNVQTGSGYFGTVNGAGVSLATTGVRYSFALADNSQPCYHREVVGFNRTVESDHVDAVCYLH
ncbi:hypothetical protein HDU76_013118 [Blyttiomyces sp. JEL0837]|nr:hypothetical protein HDU76_013118 [Blyttiomyces sp. JEL0837]